MKTVIGIAGVKTSGKSTATEIIKKYIPAHDVAFADKIKNTCAQVFDLTRDQLDKQELKEVSFSEPKFLNAKKVALIFDSFGIHYDSVRDIDANLSNLLSTPLESPRRIAQIVGTELLREHGGLDVHCRNLDLKDGVVNIVSDLRFPNEFEYLANLENVNFIPLYIQRDSAEAHVDLEKSHPSETSVFTFNDKCIKIDNNGLLEDTERQIYNELLSRSVIG